MINRKICQKCDCGKKTNIVAVAKYLRKQQCPRELDFIIICYETRTVVHISAHANKCIYLNIYTHTRLMSRYQKGKTNLGFTEVRDSEWQLH